MADLDAKVQGLAHLEQELAAPSFELQGSCTESLVALIKAALKSPNAHLSSAALACLAPLYSLLVSTRTTGTAVDSSIGSPTVSSSLKNALTLLAPGGVIDRTGDRQERVRDSAGRAFLVAARAAVAASPQLPPDSPWYIVERHIKEHGLANKGARVREQVCLELRVSL
jgi:CLIP-associating protein 1/2